MLNKRFHLRRWCLDMPLLKSTSTIALIAQNGRIKCFGVVLNHSGVVLYWITESKYLLQTVAIAHGSSRVTSVTNFLKKSLPGNSPTLITFPTWPFKVTFEMHVIWVWHTQIQLSFRVQNCQNISSVTFYTTAR